LASVLPEALRNQLIAIADSLADVQMALHHVIEFGWPVDEMTMQTRLELISNRLRGVADLVDEAARERNARRRPKRPVGP